MQRINKLLVVVVTTMLTLLILGACAQQQPAATPTPAAADEQADTPETEMDDTTTDEVATPEGEAAGDEQERPETQADRADVRIVVVTHGQAGDPFWSVVKNGVDQAAADLGVTVEYQAPDSFDMVVMSQLIDAAVASEPDGIAVSIPDPDALGPSIRAAAEAGIPLVSLNSGSDVAQELGAMVHIGQTEYEAGFGGGERMAEAGVTNALCVNQEVGNTALDLRCEGFTDAMEEAGATVEVLAVDLADPTESRERISAALASNPDVDGVLTLGPTGAAPALQALQQEGLLDQINLATFDLSPEVLEAIDAGDMLFAIDQQQYLQGYLPVVILTLHATNLNTVANDVIMTGPGFVTQENASQVIELTEQGTR